VNDQPTKPSLNKGQQEAAEGFFNFLFSDTKELIISGPGGVGKTFLMGHLIDEVMPKYREICEVMGISPIYTDVMMTATTNKAAEVLGKATHRPTKTIHSYLNLRVTKDYQTGKSKLKPIPTKWIVHERQILFVDEASMIDNDLLKYLHEGTSQSKIVYVGDHCQLAPVTESLSPIYTRNLPFYELTEPMRNAGQPALMAICDQLRETVKTGKFKPIQIVPGVIDHYEPEEMKKVVDTHFLDTNHPHRFLAYTNNQVVAYNNYFRKLRGLPPTFTVGERVVSNTVAFIGVNKGMMSVEDEFEIVGTSSSTSMVQIEPGVELEVLYLDLVGEHESFTKVPVPVDREKFVALTQYYARRHHWRLFYYLTENFPDLRPHDAATIHKAQGSTYDTVFIDLNDLSTCRRSDVAARLLYVAFSRAKNRIVLCGQLAKKYGGLVR